jgi:hypothetical protein
MALRWRCDAMAMALAMAMELAMAMACMALPYILREKQLRGALFL